MFSIAFRVFLIKHFLNCGLPLLPASAFKYQYARKSSSPPPNRLLPPIAKPGKGKCTTASTVLEIIKDVEIAVSCRKGRTGTAAGDVAFPKGKENFSSVLKRHKRRLSNKPVGTHDMMVGLVHARSPWPPLVCSNSLCMIQHGYGFLRFEIVESSSPCITILKMKTRCRTTTRLKTYTWVIDLGKIRLFFSIGFG